MVPATLDMRRLTGFVVLSAGLHAALLMPATGIHPRLAGQPDTVLSISIQAPLARAEPSQSATPKSARPGDTRRRIEPAAPKASDAGTIDAPTAGHRDTAAKDGEPNAHARTQVRALLLTDLERHFDYPLLARRRGWEGTVWLGFIVAPDGELERIHVARSSGYDALDVSALGALRRVGTLREASAWLGGRPLEMQLPVIYQLRE